MTAIGNCLRHKFLGDRRRTSEQMVCEDFGVDLNAEEMEALATLREARYQKNLTGTEEAWSAWRYARANAGRIVRQEYWDAIEQKRPTFSRA